jgi:hypothetical protein
MLIPRKAIAGLTTLAAAGAFAAATAPADAAAPTKCVRKDRIASHFFCPLNKPSRIPVYRAPDLRDRVGFLRVGGMANWFDFQVRGKVVHRGGFVNVWWAHTQADMSDEPGKPAPKGYVPEVFFRGGGVVTDEPAHSLPIFSGSRPPIDSRL